MIGGEVCFALTVVDSVARVWRPMPRAGSEHLRHKTMLRTIHLANRRVADLYTPRWSDESAAGRHLRAHVTAMRARYHQVGKNEAGLGRGKVSRSPEWLGREGIAASIGNAQPLRNVGAVMSLDQDPVLL